MKMILVCLIVFWTTTSHGEETLNQMFECQKTLTSTVVDQYRPQSGYFICDGIAKSCYLIYTDDSSYQFKLPVQATYTANEIYYDMGSNRQKIEHRLISFQEPKNKKKIYIDVFFGENNRAFARNLIQIDGPKFEGVEFEKSNSKAIQSLVQKSIDAQFGLIKNNVAKKSGPWDLQKNKASWLERISGCGWDKRVEEIRKAVLSIKD